MIAREPRRARWLTPDPLGGQITNPQSLNRYAYALNNPTTLIDPLGLQAGYCGSLTYGHGLGMCQTEANGVIMAESSLGDSTWDPFDLMNIPVSNAGPGGTIYMPGIPGSAGEDIFSSGWGDYGLLAEVPRAARSHRPD